MVSRYSDQTDYKLWEEFIMWSRADLKSRAKEILKVNYWKTVLVSLIFMFVSGSGSSSSASSSSSSSSTDFSDLQDTLSSPENLRALLIGLSIALVAIFIVWIIASLLKVFVFNPLLVGCQRYFIRCGNQPTSLNDVGFVFSSSYLNVVKIMFFKDLFTALWSLLFIIPGIIKGYEYRMIPYLLAEDPTISKDDAFATTKQMMDGDKWNTFVLDLSFIGWALLGALTCCILNIFYVAPYQNLTNAQLFDALKNKISGNPYSGQTAYYTDSNAQTSWQDPSQNPYQDQNQNPYL